MPIPLLPPVIRTPLSVNARIDPSSWEAACRAHADTMRDMRGMLADADVASKADETTVWRTS